ncbi:hypothetical protein FHU10_1911 [Serratia fonticola]|jgi:hypothetical protein|uniref:Uncharacterized protein n=1 Tax=Serratia fonticola TaxID=47917 RepID=A0A559T470_SERFO|nr:hypothetical protein [Serratia fonticola]TQI78097.1 hypothetical protein FHU09_0540 [Serratia fonticola]TQI94905.1 hypothetical protein FHU11_0253 [Serratia fonticola]TVZ69402.1 hypothetical protein FHU10_1911 [Serratia fonticola]
MKVLNTEEMQAVSGAGQIADAAKALGEGIGSIIENFGVKGAKDAAANLGNGIGLVVEAGIDVFNSIFGGIFGRKK